MKIMGINIGSISVKTAVLESDTVISHQIIPHFGDPTSIIENLENSNGIEYFGVSGYLGEINETDAIQTALIRSGKSYDAVISLGGESFVVYLLKDNRISTVISQNRCAAGSGEFLSQQIGRLNLTLEEAIELGKKGKSIHLASRCSVHCKSDITHKLNRGEASIEDIIFSVHKMISDKIVSMLQKSQQAINNVLLIGGLSRNDLFVSILKDSIVSINIHVLPESSYFEAFGTALIVQDSPIHTSPNIIVHPTFSNHQPLSEAEDFVKIIDPRQLHQEKIFGPLILGVDGGSTTTKVAVVDQSTFKIVASCYVRTNGDPLEATRHCLHEVKKQIGDQSFNLVATTGSAREIIGAFLGTNLVFNEISAHSTGALHYDTEVDTIFEIGGQDAKYIYIENGSPVDYAMNAACSAGTGSFLEESCKGDLGINVEDISQIAISSPLPVKFKSDCAAFINSDIRSALQEGFDKNDIIAGLVSSIVNNYLTKVKGPRRVGKKIFLQGGVAKNQSIAYAFAQATSKQIIVPPDPELMGAFGVALMAMERENSSISSDWSINSLISASMVKLNSFTCHACNNYCTVNRYQVGDRKFPFGGQCSKYENYWKQTNRISETKDFVELRNEIIFSVVEQQSQVDDTIRIGIPRALTTHTLLPLYYTFLKELGFSVVISDIEPQGDLYTNAPFCFPTQVAHGAVLDLLSNPEHQVDYIFFPQIQKMPSNTEDTSFLCPITQASPFLLEKAFNQAEFLIPSINFETGYENSDDLIEYFVETFSFNYETVTNAYQKAISAQLVTQEKLLHLGQEALEIALNSKKPAILLVGRAYNAYPSETSQSVSKKLASKGILTIPGDILVPMENPYTSWYFSNLILRAAELSKRHENLFLLYISNFGCNIDTFTQEYLRNHLSNKPYLKLDIDSHTADAGTQTRLEAFYEIIKSYSNRSSTSNKHDVSCKLRLIGKDYKVITSDREIIDLDDERIKYHFPIFSRYHNDIFPIAMRWSGYNASSPLILSTKQLERGLQYTSGSECIPLPIFIGQILEIYENKLPEDVIGVYMIAGGAPCVVASYVDVLNKFIKDNNLRNIFVFAPHVKNNFYNMHKLKLFRSFPLLIALADIVTEIRNVISVVSSDFISQFDDYWNNLVDSLNSPKNFNSSVEEFIRKIKHIPVNSNPQDHPVVVVSGDFFVRFSPFFYQGLVERYADRGIILKPVDLNELLLYPQYVNLTEASEELSIPSDSRLKVLRATLSSRDVYGRQYLLNWFTIKLSERYERNLRKKFHDTSLLISKQNNVGNVIEYASQHINRTIYGESVLTIGKGVETINEDYEGLLILGPFACLPFRISEAILKPICWKNDFPFLSYETDGRSLPPAFLRLVDVNIQQIMRKHKNEISPHLMLSLEMV